MTRERYKHRLVNFKSCLINRFTNYYYIRLLVSVKKKEERRSDKLTSVWIICNYYIFELSRYLVTPSQGTPQKIITIKFT